jgi:uncharacterized protein with PQ loop repeat
MLILCVLFCSQMKGNLKLMNTDVLCPASFVVTQIGFHVHLVCAVLLADEGQLDVDSRELSDLGLVRSWAFSLSHRTFYAHPTPCTCCCACR